MNEIGKFFRITIFGESHGIGVGVVIDNCPPGIKISEREINEELKKRKAGKAGTTARKEEDKVEILSGVFRGRSTGMPITLFIKNKDVKSRDYEKIKNLPRPGHADWTAHFKYKGFNDYRGGGHFSGRLTAPLVAAGAIAKKIIKPTTIKATLLKPTFKEIEEVMKEGDSIGGLVECRIKNIPPGLGEPFFDSFESLLAHGLFSIPGIKGVEFGAGFKAVNMKGSEFNDEIINKEGKTKTNNSGGINGGITNGNEVVFRVAVRPTASISKKQKTINLKSGKDKFIKIGGRHDACIALRVPPVVEAITAVVVADFMLINRMRG